MTFAAMIYLVTNDCWVVPKLAASLPVRINNWEVGVVVVGANNMICFLFG